MMRLLLLMTLTWSSFLWADTQWPTWLGDELKPVSGSHWQTKSSQDSVEFLPVKSEPKILVIVSRQAKSYDIALETLLGIYSRELPLARIVVRKLPATQTGSDGQQLLLQMLKEAEGNTHLIYTVGSKATVAVRNVYKGGKVAVVSVNAKDPVLLGLIDSDQGSGDNFAFTSLNLPAEVTLVFMRRFNPSLKQIGVLYARKNKSAYTTQYLPLKKLAEKSGVKIVPIVVDEEQPLFELEVAMTKAVRTMRLTDPTLDNSLLWLTGSSSLLSRMTEINRYSGGLAVISAVPDVVKSGPDSALMSFGVSFVNNAHQAGLYGLKILRGEVKPGDLPVGHISPPDIAISFEQARRIEQQIPFVLMEMASDVYGMNGNVIRSKGKSMQEQQ
ncbi:ABC transporter substrate binding protein [Photobacterium chitinilyticum]|uniref:ABC transporter substrate-binding protein n=1 Tax=Photobacterium chitinilyticum TaxID=2485123 RepID=A0A444JTB8_9GAMM|nr:ABC transporter substrate binding protein [Photobacterium chitinilyticum]RWX56320.1 hypothetical protein EDI28_08575 [Photobacterium chitinilyticum]